MTGEVIARLDDSRRHGVDWHTFELCGQVGYVLLFLVDPDDRLAGTVERNPDTGDARLVEHAVRVLLLGGDRLVETRGRPARWAWGLA